MIGRQGENLVFLLCVPRSGSSLATAMLHNHSKVFASQEMWFLMSLYDMRNGKSQPPYGGGEIIKQFYQGVLSDEMFEAASRQFALQVYNGLLHSSGAEIVLDKSPRYYAVLEFIDRLFPLSRRIWLVRNPLAILSSYKKAGSWRRGSQTFTMKLRSDDFDLKIIDLTIGLFRYVNYFAKDDPHSYRLSYELLTAEPVEELRRVCSFIGIDYEEDQHRYGEPKNSTKAELFYSMGVGDPLLSEHTEPHTHSVNSWKRILEKDEVEAYCRVIGAKVFHDLGYSAVLEEAERWTGVRFEQQPDEELLRMRTAQFIENTGFEWTPNYEMKRSAEMEGNTGHVPEKDVLFQQSSQPSAQSTEVQQLKMTLRALERRLETSHAEREKLKADLRSTKQKIARIKSIIPFGHRLSQLASNYLKQGGSKP